MVLGSLSQLTQWQDKTKYTELTLNTNTKLTFLNFFTIPDEPLLVLVYITCKWPPPPISWRRMMDLTVPLSPVVISYPKLQGNLLPACPADTVALNSYPCQVQFCEKNI